MTVSANVAKDIEEVIKNYLKENLKIEIEYEQCTTS